MINDESTYSCEYQREKLILLSFSVCLHQTEINYVKIGCQRTKPVHNSDHPIKKLTGGLKLFNWKTKFLKLV